MVQFPDTTRSPHPLHPSHRLTRVCFPNDEFNCNGCKSSGNDFRYRCSSNCNFNLHEFCATCPPSFPRSFLHPSHTLKLHTPQANHNACFIWLTRSSPLIRDPIQQTSLACELCEAPIDEESEIFYACKPCKFIVHPLCSQLPHYVNHRRHKRGDHELTLVKSVEHRKCGVCKEICRGWRYSCDREENCKVDIHIKCITTDTYGRSRWNVFEILKGLGVAVLSIVTTTAAGPAVGGLVSVVAKNV